MGASAVEVRVRPGEMLYLPAMWYHQVAQEGITIAVNYWHDMRYDHHWVHHQFLRDVAGLYTDEEEEEIADGALSASGRGTDAAPAVETDASCGVSACRAASC